MSVQGAGGQAGKRTSAQNAEGARAYPVSDGQGNPLNHAELCAWRFGGTCDCAAGKRQT